MARKIVNATNVKRVPSTDELFNVGDQPHIPTRGFSKIITKTTDKIELFKIDLDELKENKFKKKKNDEGNPVHHRFF